jgi:hypothetical protein
MDRGGRVIVELHRRPVLARIDTADGRAVSRGFDAEQSDHSILSQDGCPRYDFLAFVFKVVKSLDLVTKFVFEIEVGFEFKFVVHVLIITGK